MSPPLLRSGAQPALPAIPKSVDRRPPWQVACTMLTQAQAGGGVRERVRARAGGRCAKDRATARGGKKNKPRHRRGSCRLRGGKEQGTSPLVPSGTKKKKKGRFGVGAELRGQILDRPPILGGSVGPSEAPLAYRPTSSRWSSCPWHSRKKIKGRFGVGAGLRGQIPDRPPILGGSVGPDKAPLADRPSPPVPRSRAIDPSQIGFLRCGG